MATPRRSAASRDAGMRAESQSGISGAARQRGAPDLMRIWTILDVTPEERGTDWYPKLNY
jgi:predicted dithiol-disulfide oxidoreductase (DUF899 family)